MEILIAADASINAEKNAGILSLFHFPDDAVYTLAAVHGQGGGAAGRRRDLAGVVKALESMGFPFHRAELVTGGEDALLEAVHEGCYDLVVDLRMRQRAPLIRFGQACSRLAQSIETTLLLAHPAPERISRILLCSGGEEASELTIRVAAKWLRYTDAEIHLLHVMSQVPLDVEHPIEELQVGAQAAIDHDTREGKHLKRGMKWLRDAGVSGELVPVLRHGLVVDEIMAQLREGSYDMVVVGAHLRTKSRLLNLLLDDITDKLVVQTRIPVLIIRINPADPPTASSAPDKDEAA